MRKEKDGTLILETPADVKYFLRRESNAEYSPQWNSHEKINWYNTRSAILSAMLSVFYEYDKKSRGIDETEFRRFIKKVKSKNPALSQIDDKRLFSEVDKLMGEYDEFFKSSFDVDYVIHKITTAGKEYFKKFCT